MSTFTSSPIYEKDLSDSLCYYDVIGLTEYNNIINDTGYTYSGLTLYLDYYTIFAPYFDTTGHTYSNVILNNDVYTYTGLTNETHYFQISGFSLGGGTFIDPGFGSLTENQLITGFTKSIISCVDKLDGLTGTCCPTQSVLSNLPWVAITNEGGGIDNCSDYIARRTPEGWTLDFVFNKNGDTGWTESVFWFTGVRDEYEIENYADNGLSFKFTSGGTIQWTAYRFSGYCDTDSGYTEMYYVETGGTANALCTGGTANDFNITITFERFNVYDGECDLANEGGWNDLIIWTGTTEELNKKWTNERNKRLGILKIYHNSRPIYKLKGFEEVVLSDRGYQPFTHVVGGGVTGSNGIYEGICCYDIKYASYFEDVMDFIYLRNRYLTETFVNYNISECEDACADNIVMITPTRTPSVTQTPSITPTITRTPSITPSPASIPTVLGLLYNACVIDDPRNFVVNGWRVPTENDFGDLNTYLINEGLNGGSLKDTGTIYSNPPGYWIVPNAGATNITKFKATGSGRRTELGIFENIYKNTYFWTSTQDGLGNNIRSSLSAGSFTFIPSVPSPRGQGLSIRLIKESTTLTNGQLGTYVGFNGIIYRTVCIGTQEWLSSDLAETRYQNGEYILEIRDGDAWSGGTTCGLTGTTGGYSAYNNNWSYVPGIAPTPTPTKTTTPSITPSLSVSSTITPSITPSETPSETPSITITPSITPSLSLSLTITPSLSISPTVTPTMTPTQTPSPPEGYGLLYNWYVGGSAVDYGALYNWYVIDDAREITNTGWHVPNRNEGFTLFNALGGTNIAGGYLKESGTFTWAAPNSGVTNSSGFTGRPSGKRSGTDGSFSLLGYNTFYWTNQNVYDQEYWVLRLYYDSTHADTDYNLDKTGLSIRLVKDSTTLTSGQTGTYVGNDGQIYGTICIGTQEWLAENLRETKFRNNDSIPIITDNGLWTSDTDGAMCYYNNNINNARSVAPLGWRVPTIDDVVSLDLYYIYLGQSTGGKLKETGLSHWNSPNSGADNLSGFTARGSGYRYGYFNPISSQFAGLKDTCYLWTTNNIGNGEAYSVDYNTDYMMGHGIGFAFGCSIRFIKNDSTNPGIMFDNDGNLYPTTKIGNQVWSARNLRVTHYNDGTVIPEVADNNLWSGLTTGALCSYGNNWNNVYPTPTPTPTPSITPTITTSITITPSLSLSPTPTPSLLPISDELLLTFDSIANASGMIGGDATSLDDWNSAFGFPTNPFTSINIVGNEINLKGGSNIKVPDGLFSSEWDGDGHLISIVDALGCIVETGYDSFGDAEADMDNIILTTAILPALLTGGTYSFYGCKQLIDENIDFSSLQIAMDNCFRSCHGLINPIFPSLTTASEDCFYDCRYMNSPNFSGLTTAGEYCFQSCSTLTTPNFLSLTTADNYCFISLQFLNTDFPSLITAGGECFYNCIGLIDPDFSSLETAGNLCFYSCTALTSISLLALTTAGNLCFYSCTALTSISLPLLTTAGTFCISNCTALTTISLPALTTAGDYCFDGCTALTTISLPALTAANTSLGATSGDNSVFNGITGKTITLTVPVYFQTNNGGSPDGDIQYLAANNNETIIYV